MKHVVSYFYILACLSVFVYSIFEKGDFIREFLTYSYGLHIFGVILLASLIVIILIKRDQFTPKKLSNSLVIGIGWLLFIIIHPLFSVKDESYYKSYLIVSLLLLFAVYSLFRLKTISKGVAYIPLLFVGVLESIFVLFQASKISPSHSDSFSITGTTSNPNLAAVVICISIPACIGLMELNKRKFRNWGIILLFLMTTSLIITRCRSAILALSAVSIVYLFELLRKKNTSKHLFYLVIFPIILLFIFFVINKQKIDSTNGRLTIWKLSSEMITQKPLTGYGYGYFEKSYNLQQANYFNQKTRLLQEQMNASFTSMAYNEYIEQSVMGGLIGGILFFLFIVLLLWNGWKLREDVLISFMGVLAFAIMSLFNFTVAYPILFFCFLVYAAVIINSVTQVLIKQKPRLSFFSQQKYIRAIFLFYLVSVTTFLLLSLQKYNAQKQLTVANNLLNKGHKQKAAQILYEIEPKISTSEAFYTTKARYHLANKDLKRARLNMMQVLNYTSNPAIMIDLSQLSQSLGYYEEAEKYLKISSGIEPHLFRPRVLLMELYNHTGQTQKASTEAQAILDLKPKFDSEQISLYKKRAKKILLDTNNNPQFADK